MASGAVDPISAPQVYDVIELGGLVSPGYCEVGEFKRKHTWDVKRGKGALGATITFVGVEPARGTIKFHLWTPAHFQQWEAFRTALKFNPTKKAVQPVDCWHPSLLDLDIKSLVTENIGNVMHEGGQHYTISVDFLEYLPPPKASAVSTPTGSKATGGGLSSTPANQQTSAQDEQDKQIHSLMQKAAQPDAS